jgi:hypothetical protein
MPLDLAAICPQSAGLLAKAAARRPESSWWAILGPILLEMLQTMIEECFEDEAEFVEVAGAMSDVNVRQLRHDIFVELRQQKFGDRRLRRGQARLAAADVATVCAAAPDGELGACYREFAA